MDEPLLLAIDVGLTNVKAVLFDGNGALRARTSVSYPTLRTEPDAVEQEPGPLAARAGKGGGQRVSCEGPFRPERQGLG